ncbi:c-type cytochrome biogenesis protein CcmI [Bordetella genomosp. 2]|uniref:C-type cytochrome biogenesis protein CcmI n=1 Tax=Bordetella genomosp. 2 TaxID=1983456 RepID=A0A261VEF5_9BORD|nr:c-type cytochrome biogenesis protein CcmI [Bordetella genomosp. 2]OZI72514.1 c-type cytochrome biogenesis protein CcmI [Bordetella genomosp. 2]
MTAFWLYAALLLLAALAFILGPQLRAPRARADADRAGLNVGLYRERVRELEMQHGAGALTAAQLEAARIEAARELLDAAHGSPGRAADAPLGRAVPLAMAVLAPLLGLALYLHWGSLDRVMLARQYAGHPAQGIEEMTARLEASLAAAPDSAEGWFFLGRTYMAQDRMADAARAFERAAALAGRPPELLGHWAQALYFAGDQQWTPQLQALTDEALAGDPQEAASLGLAGMAAFQAERYAEAAAYWERLAAALPEADPSRAAIADGIARARELDQARKATAPPAP